MTRHVHAGAFETPQCRDCLETMARLEKKFIKRLVRDRVCAKHRLESACLLCKSCGLLHCDCSLSPKESFASKSRAAHTVLVVSDMRPRVRRVVAGYRLMRQGFKRSSKMHPSFEIWPQDCALGEPQSRLLEEPCRKSKVSLREIQLLMRLSIPSGTQLSISSLMAS
jgi:hypothetical protein